MMLIALLLAGSVGSKNILVTVDGDEYTLIESSGEAQLEALSGVHISEAINSGHLVIPDEVVYDGIEYTVVSIMSDIFSKYTLDGVTEITLPKHMKMIPPRVFLNMPTVAKMNFGNALFGVSSMNFRNMPMLTNLDLPEGLEALGWGTVTDIGIERFVCPPKLRRIYGETFGDPTASNLPNLVELDLGNVVMIGSDCLRNLPKLMSVNIPGCCKEIGTMSLINMDSLAELKYEWRDGAGIRLYADHYGNCPLLKDVYVEDVLPFKVEILSGAIPDMYFNRAECTLHVPVGSREVYKDAYYWREFGTIIDDVIVPKRYHPMVEEGKTWKYRFEDLGFEATSDDDYIGCLKIEGKKEINGVEYAVLNFYAERDAVSGMPSEMQLQYVKGYMREDLENKQVWYIDGEEYDYSNNVKERLLYDFSTPAQSNLTDLYFSGNGENFLFEALNGSLRNSIVIEENIMITEGLGWLMRQSKCNEYPYNGYYGDLLGRWPVCACFKPHIGPYSILYEIVDGDGTVLYTHEKDRFHSGVERLTSDSDRISMIMRSEEVHINVNSGVIGDVRLISASGIVVDNFMVNEPYFSMSLANYPAGTYIVIAGGDRLKVVIR